MIDEIKIKFKAKLESYEIDKKCGQLSIDSICHLFPNEVEVLLKYIEDSRHIWEGNIDEVRYTSIGSVIGTHAGPGAVAVAFFKG